MDQHAKFFLFNLKTAGAVQFTVLVFLCLTAISIVSAQHVVASDLTIRRHATALLNATVNPSGPGIAVLIARNEKAIFRAARGRANIELDVPLTAADTFRIASVTKTFTAALVIKLAEKGELSLDAPLKKFLSDFPGAENITIRELLNHTAGVSDQAPPSAIQPGFSRRDVDITTLIAEIAKRPAAFAPGASQSYSNAGFILLGAVIEKVTGKPWHVALDELILRPLGLRNTRYGSASVIIPGRVAGYTTDTPGRKIENAPYI